MAENPTYTIAEVLAAPQGTNPWYLYWLSLAKHLKNAQDDISNLEVGAAPGWNAAIDTRWYVADTSASDTNYTGTTTPSAGAGDSLQTGYRIAFAGVNQKNAGACDLDVGTDDGAVSIKKIDGAGAKQDLVAGDLAPNRVALLFFDGTDWILENAPVFGKQTIWVPSGAMWVPLTGGATEDGVTDPNTSGSKPNPLTITFGAGSNAYAQFSIMLPKAWDKGNLQFQVLWYPSNTNTGDVRWNLAAVPLGEGDALNTSLDDGQVNVDDAGGGTAEDIQLSSESGDVSMTTPNDDEVIWFRFGRLGADANDTFTGDAKLLGIKVFFTTEGMTDD